MFLKLTLFQPHHGWLDFYSSDVPPPSSNNSDLFNYSRYENLINKQAITLLSNAYVVNCYFYSITYSGSGAAIYLYQEDAHFLVEFSTFVKCSTINGNYFGGGIYIYYADFAMNHVCAFECKSSYQSSFTYVSGPTSTSRTVNSIHHSSIAYCFAESYYTMYHSYGYIDIQSVNLSHNTATQYSALVCQPSSIKDNIGTRISYSSFADNNATSQYCVFGNRGVNTEERKSFLI